MVLKEYQRPMKFPVWKKLDLQWKILISIAAGLVAGMILNRIQSGTEFSFASIRAVLQLGGDVFIRLLSMLIVPLVFCSIYMSIVRLGTFQELKKIGAVTGLYYLLTTALAVLVGMMLVNIIHPGLGIDSATVEKLKQNMAVPERIIEEGVDKKNAVMIILETFVRMIPANPIAAMAQADILQVIFFTLVIAVISAMVGKQSAPLVQLVDSLDQIMIRTVMVIMNIAPYCIFMLVTVLMMDLGFQAIFALSKYAITVICGLFIHAFLTLPLLVFLLGKTHPFRLFKAMLPAILTAWSTASSVATLPITLECLEKRARIPRKIGNFVLPLGATVNMDGTALYESVAAIFIAELLGYPIPIGIQVVIFITATLAAIGAAAIPGAGLVTMGIVLTAAGLPLEGIGLILAIDRILDQFRTAVNVWGDATAGVVVSRMDHVLKKNL
jgi:proton glutamate symport protein